MSALTAAVVIGFAALGDAATVSLAGAEPGTGFVRPVLGARISQPFGCTSYPNEPMDPRCPSRHWHSGIDLAVAAGTPVLATSSGVASVVDDRFGYGLHIVIDHGRGLSSLYGHLERVGVVTNDRVIAGQSIGAIGSTGNSSGPHLHFEIRRDGIAEDPQLDLPLP